MCGMVSHFSIHSDNLTKNSEPTRKDQNDKLQYINFGEDDQMEIQGFVFSKLKSNICLFLYATTFGILRLIFHWYPVLHLKATHRKCDLTFAEKALITENYQEKTKTQFVKNIRILNSEHIDGPEGKLKLKYRLANGQTKEKYEIRILRCKKLSYIWDEELLQFARLSGLDRNSSKLMLHTSKGLTKEEQRIKQIVYGKNRIVTPEKSILELLILEALTPFYIFQLFSLIVWAAEKYYYYSIAIIIMSVVGISTSIIQTRKNQKNLKGTVNFSSTIIVSRTQGTFEKISTTDLVPGDIIVVSQQDCEMHCDAVLLHGSCIVNESMLTGESVPVRKTALDHQDGIYNVREDVNSTLFCGTKIIQTRTRDNEPALAVVIRTGFLTSKGELVRSILYPPPADFKFDRDSYKFIGILAVIAVLAVIYTVVSKSSRQIVPIVIAIKALDIITIVIPPALPAVMTVGKLFAINRLKKSQIFCINSRVVNVSGSINCICFDKTGTLTEDALDMWGVVPVYESAIKNIREMSTSSDLFRGMTTCHSLTFINGKCTGDPLDVKMFESTGWTYVDDHSELRYGNFVPIAVVKNETLNEEIGIIRQFQFSSSLQRMTVIVRAPENPYFEVFCKGAPEKIISLSKQATVPNDIHHKLKEFTKLGYRVIGLGTRIISNDVSYDEVTKLHREDVEKDLNFLGLIVFENPLKPETLGVINTLKEAHLKLVMITGDNIQTAVTVARDCSIIENDTSIIEILTNEPSKNQEASITFEMLNKCQSNVKLIDGKVLDLELGYDYRNGYCFVISGQHWANVVKYFPNLIPRIVTKGAVFARMSGSQKQQVIESLKNLGYYVAMCGDGANDCGALKAAHVGISLSEAESSVASPFTSKQANITCTSKIIKEGRAALVTSFGLFQMMLCYSLTEFISIMILYGIDSNLTSMQFLFIDICLVLNFAASFGRTKAWNGKLSKTPPRTSLLGFIPCTSMVLFLVVACTAQWLAFALIQNYSWFEPFEYDLSNTNFINIPPSYENYAVFCTSMFQYITMAVIFSKGKPYRKNLFTNHIFVFSLLAMTLVCGYITLIPAQWLCNLFEMKIPPENDGKWLCILIAAIAFVICYLVQSFVIERFLENIIEPAILRCFNSKKVYVHVLEHLKSEPQWPEINSKNHGFDNVAYVATEKAL